MTRSARLFDLVHLLGGRRSRTVAEIASHFEVTERTVYRDLVDLGRRVPLVRDEYGYRLMEDAVLRPLSLSPREWAVLRLALDNPSIRRSSDLAKRLDLVASKLDSVHPGSDPPRAVVLADLERTGPVGPAAFSVLEESVASGRAVEIDYVSLRSGRRSRRGVDPWSVFHREGAWYLAGRCHRSDEPRVFRLDRVAGARALDASFDPPSAFRIDEFLRDAWSLHHGAAVHEVVVHFDRSLAPLIGNARHHEGEEIARLPGGDLEYRVQLAHLDEIARWVVAFGGKARAIAPEELIDRVAALAEGASEAHRRVEAAKMPVRGKRGGGRVAARIARK